MDISKLPPKTSKDQLLEMFVSNTLFNFLLKRNVIRKGDTICYGKMLDISVEDMRAYFAANGFPGLNIPRHQIRQTPHGGEGDTEWTLKDGLYEVWYTERNDHNPVFSTASKAEFEAYWASKTFYSWEYKLNQEWIF